MDKITKRIVTTSTWSAGADLTPVNLPREGLITEVRVRFMPTVTGTGTIGVDGLFRTIQNLKILGDGGRAYLGLSGEQMSRILAFTNRYDFGAPMVSLQGNSITTNTIPHVTFVFHPGSNPQDPFDLSAVIPARALSTLQILVSTTADDVVADTITGGTYYYEIHEVLGMPVPQDIKTPVGSSYTVDLAATYSDYSYKIDVPAGAWLRRIIFMQQDDTAIPLRVDTEITGIRLELPRTASAFIESNWEDIKAEAAIRAGVMTTINEQAMAAAASEAVSGAACFMNGFTIVDLRKYFDPRWGMDLTNYQTGDVKLALTVAVAAGEVIIYWDQLKPVDQMYVGK